MEPQIYLASRSPRRVELLKQLGITCQTLPADIDETVLLNESPIDYVIRLARQKAEACLAVLNPAQLLLPILAADTTVALGKMILGKPMDDNDAKAMLKMLSGTTHEVHTAVALAFTGNIEVMLSTTTVEMMTLTETQLDEYIATGEHSDKAGSYGIQGRAGAWIKRIEGSYTGVMGLPIYETMLLLNKHVDNKHGINECY
ncbi:MAG: septum formation inhibitor Maf [Methylotenera sp.]|nr:septum formation inhibitor Maf [Methylotenera sp.]